jgi:hypothetical protein
VAHRDPSRLVGSGLVMALTDRVSEGGAKRIDKSDSPAG